MLVWNNQDAAVAAAHSAQTHWWDHPGKGSQVARDSGLVGVVLVAEPLA
jgi:hypothetical protein